MISFIHFIFPCVYRSTRACGTCYLCNFDFGCGFEYGNYMGDCEDKHCPAWLGYKLGTIESEYESLMYGTTES